MIGGENEDVVDSAASKEDKPDTGAQNKAQQDAPSDKTTAQPETIKIDTTGPAKEKKESSGSQSSEDS